jgi:hypothetical protein
MWKALSSWEPPEKKRKGAKDNAGADDDSNEEVSASAPLLFSIDELWLFLGGT